MALSVTVRLAVETAVTNASKGRVFSGAGALRDPGAGAVGRLTYHQPEMALGRVDGERVWGHLRMLCEEIGPRLSGTEGDERAVTYMLEHFRRCGARVE